MSSPSSINSQIILEYFSQFLQKLLQNNPNTSKVIHEDFEQMSQILINEPSNLEKVHGYLNFLHEKYNPTSLTKSSKQKILDKDPHDVFLENFESDLQKHPSTSVKRFTTLTFQDYLRKNSIRPQSSSLFEIQQFDFSKYSYLHDFLPDSQNFYRALGLGFIDACLGNSQFINRLVRFQNDIQEKRIKLSTDSYLYSSEDLQNIFCKRIAELIDLTEQSNDFLRVREILLLVASKDSIFDNAIISFVKANIDKYLQEKIVEDYHEDFDQHKRRMHMMESGVIGDLMVYIAEIFQITFVIQTIENKTIKGTVYHPHDKFDCPEVHLLNEKYSVYQNFSLLSVKKEQTQEKTSMPIIVDQGIVSKTASDTSSSESEDEESQSRLSSELLFKSSDKVELEQQQEDIMELHLPNTFHNSSQENDFQKPLGYSDDNVSNKLNNSNSLDKIFVNPMPHNIEIPHQEFEPKALRFSNNSLLQIKINPDESLEPVPNQKTPVRQVKTFRVHNTEEFERIADEHERNPDYRVEVKQCSFIESENKPSVKVLDNEEEGELFVSTSRRFERNIEDRHSKNTNYDAFFSNRRFSENNAIAVTRSFNENSLVEKEKILPVSKQLPKIHEEDKLSIHEVLIFENLFNEY